MPHGPAAQASLQIDEISNVPQGVAPFVDIELVNQHIGIDLTPWANELDCTKNTLPHLILNLIALMLQHFFSCCDLRTNVSETYTSSFSLPEWQCLPTHFERLKKNGIPIQAGSSLP